MTLDEFIRELRDDVSEFYVYWRTQQGEKNAEFFPYEMGPGDWYEQWLAFISSEETKEG